MFGMKKETCANNQAFLKKYKEEEEKRLLLQKKEDEKKLMAQKEECRSLVTAMLKYIRNPQSHESHKQEFPYSGGFECSFKGLFEETKNLANVSVRADNRRNDIYDDPWPMERSERDCYHIKRFVVGEKVEYEIY